MASRAMHVLEEDLIDAVYRAALEPELWPQVMSLMRKRYPSSAQTFYFLDRRQRHVRPVCLEGIDLGLIGDFDRLYFAPDNPWMRVSKRMHLPGVVRTNERLDRFLGERGALYPSAYYNDWMRPQGFHYTMGNTLLAEGDTVANITLMRPADMATFSEVEVQAFDRLSRHMTRALQTVIRLDGLGGVLSGPAAIDALPHPLALVDGTRGLLHANPAMESLLRRRQGLLLRQGVVCTPQAAAQQALAARVADAMNIAADRPPSSGPLWLDCGPQSGLAVHVYPVAGGSGRYLPPRRAVLLMVIDAGAARSALADALRDGHGCTPSEARLALLLADGLALRAAAGEMGITYGSARVYLKTVFEKLGVHSQAQLVSRLSTLHGGTATLPAPGVARREGKSSEVVTV